jgi:hypothetical protein
MEAKKIYIKNRLTIKSKMHSWLYKYTYNPYLVDFHQENSDYNGNLSFEKQFDDISIKFYNDFVKDIFLLKNELNNVNKSTFWGTNIDAQYVDFAYYDNKLVYQFITETIYPENWYKFIQLKYPELHFSLEYIVEKEIYNKNKDEKICLCMSQDKEHTIYQNVDINHQSYKKVD